MANKTIDYSTLKIRNRFGSSKPMYYTLVYPELATSLIDGWNTVYAGEQDAIRYNLMSIVMIIKCNDMVKMRINPNTKWINVNPVCVRILYDAGVLQVSTVSEQVNRALSRNVTCDQLSGVLEGLASKFDVAEAFTVLADRWILHENNGKLYVANKNVREDILGVITEFVEENEDYAYGAFHYDFQLRGFIVNEYRTVGESIADVRGRTKRGALVRDGGDTEPSVFDLNAIYMESDSSYRQDIIDTTGYHNPNLAGLLLARVFQPMIIVHSVEQALGCNMTAQAVASYLRYRGNDVMLENLQSAMEMWDHFNSNFDFSNISPRDAIKSLIDFLYLHSNQLTEEGLAVLKCLKTYIKPMLRCNGVYECVIRDGLKTEVTYDQFFQNQLNRFGQLMSEPHALPATMKAFLVDGMYGAGKRCGTRDIGHIDELPVDTLRALDELFDEAYEKYNKDGNLDGMRDKEKQRAIDDSKFTEFSLDAIRDAGGDDAKWEEFISDGVVDPTWEALF